VDSSPDQAPAPRTPAKRTTAAKPAASRAATDAATPARKVPARSTTDRSTAPRSTAPRSTTARTQTPRTQTPRTPTARSTSDRPAPTRTPRPKPVETVLSLEGLVKRFGDTIAVAGIDLAVESGSFYGIVHGVDVWHDPVAAKRNMGVLPDRLRLFDRLTGAQLLFYSGTLRGLNEETVRTRTSDLAGAFGFEDALGRLVADYSAGMTKKIALAAAMIHSPRVLILDEPFESVDPVSAANVTQILRSYVDAGGTVVVSSHSMDLIQRICDHVAVVVHGAILDSGTMASVRKGKTLEDRFVELAGGRTSVEGMSWLNSFSD
jgi:ABC-2 type transport system ATP-binding protein